MEDFYQVTDVVVSDVEWQGCITFNPSHRIFKGHFPGQPVVPGACLIDLVQDMFAQHILLPVQLINASMVKFIQPVLPETVLLLKLKWVEATGQFTLNASATTVGTTVFKIEAIFRVSTH